MLGNPQDFGQESGIGMVTESFSAVGGTLLFTNGGCQGTDGFHHLFED